MAARQKPKQAKLKTKQSLFHTIPCPLCSATIYSVKYPGQFPDELSEDFLKKVYRSSSDQSLFEQVVQCDMCGVVYLNPRLNPELIIDAYAEGEDESFVAQDAMRMRTFEKALRELVREYTIALSKDTRVLDIGSAGGAFLRAVENMGMSAIGIEPNKWMSKYARDTYHLDARAGILSDYRFDDDTFHMVTLWDVIEHVPAPTDELKEIHRIMKPDGLLVINYPDYSSLPARLLGRKWPFWLSVHLTYYTPTTIRKQLASTGFSIISIRPHWQTLELGYVLQRMTPYFGFAKSIKSFIERIGLARFPIRYWIGQMRVEAKKQ